MERFFHTILFGQRIPSRSEEWGAELVYSRRILSADRTSCRNVGLWLLTADQGGPWGEMACHALSQPQKAGPQAASLGLKLWR